MEIMNTVNDSIRQDTNERFGAELAADVLKGNILEAIIDFDLDKSNRYKLRKYRNSDGFEIDMMILNDASESVDLYEIKYSDQIRAEQVKNMINDDFIAEILDMLRREYGIEYKVGTYNVLYNGDDSAVQYKPSEVFDILESESKELERFVAARKWESLKRRAEPQEWNDIGIHYVNITDFLVGN